MYNEDLGQKTNKGGLKHKKVRGKEVTIYPNLDDRTRCPVNIFYKYHCQLPLKCKCPALYLHLKKVYDKDRTWYQDYPIGVNKLRNTVKDMMKEAGLSGHFTNHSLCSTAATRLYQGRVEEQVICEITGHRSLAVCSYKCTHDSQKSATSSILQNNPLKRQCRDY